MHSAGAPDTPVFLQALDSLYPDYVYVIISDYQNRYLVPCRGVHIMVCIIALYETGIAILLDLWMLKYLTIIENLRLTTLSNPPLVFKQLKHPQR